MFFHTIALVGFAVQRVSIHSSQESAEGLCAHCRHGFHWLFHALEDELTLSPPPPKSGVTDMCSHPHYNTRFKSFPEKVFLAPVVCQMCGYRCCTCCLCSHKAGWLMERQTLPHRELVITMRGAGSLRPARREAYMNLEGDREIKTDFCELREEGENGSGRWTAC